MEFFKQAFRFIIFDIILFAVYYVLNTLLSPLAELMELANGAVIVDAIMSVIAWAGFYLLYIARIADRRGCGIYYLFQNESSPRPLASAFNPISEWKSGNFDLLVYAFFCAVPASAYIASGAAFGQNVFITELFLPQTLFFKLTGSVAAGYLISVVLFYLISSTVSLLCRKKWLRLPLSDEERNLVDPEYVPETPPEAEAEEPTESTEE